MRYQKILKMSESISYPSVGSNTGADFAQMSITLPNDIPVGEPLKIIYSDPQSRKLVTSKIKEAQEIYSLENRCFLKSTGIYHIPLLYFPHDKGFDCAVTNPIITKNSTNMDIKKLHNDKFDSRKTAKIGLDVSLKASIVPDDAIVNLRNLVRDYRYLKDLRSAIVLRLYAKLRVSSPAYLNMLSKVITQTSLKLLRAYPLATDMLAVPKSELVEIIRNMTRFGGTYALARYDAIYAATKDAVVFGHVLPSNALWIRLCIKIYREYQIHLDSILEELNQAVGRLEGTPDYDRTSFIQTLHGVSFLSAVALIVETGSFDLFSSPKELYAHFGLDPGIDDSGKFHGNRIHMFRRGSNLTRRTLHMVIINNLRVDKAARVSVNPITYDYYAREYASKKENVAIGAVTHKICNIISVILRDNKPFEPITPKEHRERYAAKRPESVDPAA